MFKGTPLIWCPTAAGHNVEPIKLYVICVILIYLFCWLREGLGMGNFLEKKVIDHESWAGFDGWAVSHFMFWGLLGWLYPNHPGAALVLSVAWEGIEWALGEYTSDDWYGRFTTDPFFNIAGYLLGSASRNTLRPPTHPMFRPAG